MTYDRLKTSSGFPKLKCKAAVCRHLTEFALELAQRFCGPREVAVVQLMCEFNKIVNSEGLHLSRAAIERIPVLARQLCILYNELSNAAKDARPPVKAWKASPKLHLFLELCEVQVPDTGINPSFYWTYVDEDLVGQLVEVAEHCHPKTVAATGLGKWSLLAFE